MTHPAYTVVYFAIHGRAEPIRLLLASLGLPFQEDPIARETWMERKGTMPLGQVPVLVERAADGTETRIPQSQSILRHLGRVHGRYGQGETGMVRCDVLADTVMDVRAPLVPLLAPNVRGKDPAALREAVDQKLPPLLTRLEKLHGEGPGNGLFVDSEPTWADCVAFDFLSTLDTISPATLVSFPGLRAFVAAMRAHPRLAGYLATRRPSELASLRDVLDAHPAA